VKHAIDLAEQIPGTYWHAAAILKLELDPVVRVPAQELRFEIGGGSVTRRVHAAVGPMISGPGSLSVPLHWTATEHPNLFPVMDGELHISDVAGNQIELRLDGKYHTPLGAVGAIANAMLGRRVADKSLRGFLSEVAQRLESSLVAHAGRAGVET